MFYKNIHAHIHTCTHTYIHTYLQVLLLSDNELDELCKGMSNFEKLHTIDLKRNRLTRLSRGLGGLFLYHALKQHDLSENMWEFPQEEVRAQGEVRMLEFVGELWKAKLANGVKVVSFGLNVVPDEVRMHEFVYICIQYVCMYA
jgi:hypothetical protein